MAKTEEALPSAAANKTTPAAYVPFRTFLSAMDSLEHGIPKVIDRTMWRSQSGVVQSQIMMALRFFDLVDDEDRPTQALHRLVDAKEKRSEHIRALLHHSYHAIIEHDLTKMTPKMLEDAMDEYHVTGDTKRKAVTFFLQAARFADLPMHPLLSGQIRSTLTRRKRQRTKEHGASMEEQVPLVPSDPGGMTWAQMLLAKFPAFDPAWPDDLKTKWFDAFGKLMKRGEETEFTS